MRPQWVGSVAVLQSISIEPGTQVNGISWFWESRRAPLRQLIGLTPSVTLAKRIRMMLPGPSIEHPSSTPSTQIESPIADAFGQVTKFGHDAPSTAAPGSTEIGVTIEGSNSNTKLNPRRSATDSSISTSTVTVSHAEIESPASNDTMPASTGT